MSPRELLEDGRLTEAIAFQSLIVHDRPADSRARLFLAELLGLAGQLTEARRQLDIIDSDDPGWPDSRRRFRRLLKAEFRRSHRFSRPTFLQPPPRHVKLRLLADRAIAMGDWESAGDYLDRAEAIAPYLDGHIDGREFAGLRDADDRFASVLELFVGSTYLWVPFESIRRLRLAPVNHILDLIFRPARFTPVVGREIEVILPLVYPGSHRQAGNFALAQDTDWLDVGGFSLGIGARLLLAGDDELTLGECSQIDIR